MSIIINRKSARDAILGSGPPKEAPLPIEAPSDPLDLIAEELIDAIHSKDRASVADALHAFLREIQSRDLEQDSE